MFVRDLVVGIEDLLAGQFKDHGLLGGLPHLVLQALFELLTFFDDGIKLLGNVFVVALLQGRALVG